MVLEIPVEDEAMVIVESLDSHKRRVIAQVSKVLKQATLSAAFRKYLLYKNQLL